MVSSEGMKVWMITLGVSSLSVSLKWPEEEAEAKEEDRKAQGAFQLLNIGLEKTV